MRTVHKFTLDITGDQQVRMPAGADVLSVGWQDNRLVVWAKVWSHLDPEPRRFLVRETGHEIGPDVGRFVGTVQTPAGDVCHVFEGL